MTSHSHVKAIKSTLHRIGKRLRDQHCGPIAALNNVAELEPRGGIEPPMKVLQTFALPLGYRAFVDFSSAAGARLDNQADSNAILNAGTWIESFELASTVALPPSTTLFNCTNGVFPMSSAMFLATFISAPLNDM